METNQEQNAVVPEKNQGQSGHSSGKKRKNRRHSKKNHSSSSAAASAQAEKEKTHSQEPVNQPGEKEDKSVSQTNAAEKGHEVTEKDAQAVPKEEKKQEEAVPSKKEKASPEKKESDKAQEGKKTETPSEETKTDSSDEKKESSEKKNENEKETVPQAQSEPEKPEKKDSSENQASVGVKQADDTKAKGEKKEEEKNKEKSSEQRQEPAAGQLEKDKRDTKEKSKEESGEPEHKSTEHKKRKRRKRHGITFYVVIFTFLVVIGSAAAMASLFLSSNNAFFSNIPEVELPVFTKMKLDDVLENPEYANFRFRIEEIYSNEIAAGVIADQSPKPPKSVKENATITLKVSKGAENITVPSVVGWNRDTAREKFKDLGLSVLIQSESDENVAPNKVIKTDPEAGAVMHAGDVITMYVSRVVNESTILTVPNCVGSSQESAKNILSNMGLVGITSLKDSSEPAGTVISQSPAAGSKTGANGTVQLYVSNGKGATSATGEVVGGQAAQEGQQLYPGGPMVGNADGQVVPGSVTGHIHTWQTIAGTSNQVCTVCGQTR